MGASDLSRSPRASDDDSCASSRPLLCVSRRLRPSLPWVVSLDVLRSGGVEGVTATAAWASLAPSPTHPDPRSFPVGSNVQIRFLLLQNRQGKTRLAKYYVPLDDDEKRQLEFEVHRTVVNRDAKFTNFVEFRNYKIIYRRYAGLFFSMVRRGMRRATRERTRRRSTRRS